MAPAKANHLICWRSSPCDRRKRTIKETAPATVTASARYPPTYKSTLTSAPTSSMPNGLVTLRLEVCIGPGLKDPTKSSTAAMRSSQSTARQRCESGCPLGKSSKTNANNAMPIGPPRNASSQAAVPPPGSEPGLLTTAYMAYWPLANVDVKERPMAQKIQPIVFLGCREATRAPTVVNNMNTSNPHISKTSGVWLIPLGVGEFRILNESHTITDASETAQSDQASQAVGRLILPPPLPCLLVPVLTTSSPGQVLRSRCCTGLRLGTKRGTSSQ